MDRFSFELGLKAAGRPFKRIVTVEAANASHAWRVVFPQVTATRENVISVTLLREPVEEGGNQPWRFRGRW
jgi:hypothetical protein